MKKLIILLAALTVAFLVPSGSSAQYCNVTTAISYTPQMPGIKNVSVGTIDRNSASLECAHPCNSVVNTGLSTNLQRGQTYTFSITHTRDSIIFPLVRNNIRVWIDYNQNTAFDTTTETAVRLELQTFGTSSVTFMVPLTATLGSTRMRVTAKMSEEGGHIWPSPCDDPVDPFGYHGEMEDYSVNITAAPTGIDVKESGESISIMPASNGAMITIHNPGHREYSISLFDLTGRFVREVHADGVGKEMLVVPVDYKGLPEGIYFYRISPAGAGSVTGKLTVITN